MVKKNNTPTGIFIEAIGLYFSNIDKFIKYLTFPVLGQILGLGLVLLTTYFYSVNLPNLIEKYPQAGTLPVFLTLTLIITLPGLLIFMKAFWEYLIAYGAINSMYKNMKKSGKVYDFEAHKEVVTRRTLTFIGIWFLYGVFTIIAICPLFWVICGIIFVYAVLTFQVFTFEEGLSPILCIKKSANLIKGHFTSTLVLLVLVGLLTYLFIPQIANKLLEISGVSKFLSQVFIPVINLFDLEGVNSTITTYGLKALSPASIALTLFSIIISQILIQYTLPLRSIMWSMWYEGVGVNKMGNCTKNSSSSKTSKRTKRPSVKLMTESHKKYGKKKIDKNILKRAMEKDDEI